MNPEPTVSETFTYTYKISNRKIGINQNLRQKGANELKNRTTLVQIIPSIISSQFLTRMIQIPLLLQLFILFFVSPITASLTNFKETKNQHCYLQI